MNLAKNLAEKEINIRSIPLVIQYNKRDLDGTDSEILPIDLLEKDLNSMLEVPSFPASALKGMGVFETLRSISKLVVKDVSSDIRVVDKQFK
jgi:signal recognition particle receptor subunit beta